MKTLFLDFDGVLHPEFCHESQHFCCMSSLEAALRSSPDWEIVITSTWRLKRSLEELRRPFTSDIAARIVGMTPRFGELTEVPDALVGYPREAECVAWLRAHGRSAFPWLALDDRPWLFRPFSRSLFLVDPTTGLMPSAVGPLVEHMNRL